MELHKLEKKRLGHVADAEKAARALVFSLGELHAAAEQQRKTCRRGNFPQPLGLGDPAMTTRIGQLLSAVFTRMPGGGLRYGHIMWHSSFRKSSDDWSEAEESTLEQPLLDSTKGMME